MTTPAAFAATFVVNSTADTSDGTCDASDCTLREAVEATNVNAGDDAIIFDTTVFATARTITVGSAFNLNDNVTITGPTAGVVVDGVTDAFVIFIVNDRSADFNGLTIRNGSTGIVNFGTAGITVTNATLDSNGSTGIVNFGTVTVNNSTLSNNIDYGIVNDGMATVNNSTVRGNGDGVLIENNDNTVRATFTIVNSSVSDNNSNGIANYSTATITNCSLSGNVNGISNLGTSTVTNSTLSDNAQSGISNGSLVGGGGYVLATIAINNCTLSGNRIMGIKNIGTSTVTNSTLSGDRYGIYNDVPSTITVANCTLSGNSDYGLYNDGSGALHNSLLVGNTLANVAGSNPAAAGADSITTGTAAAAGLETSDGLNAVVLKANGGPTQTIALTTFGTAVNGGNNALAKDAGGNDLTTDQRGVGYPRIVNGAVDIGAFELVGTPYSISGRIADSSGTGIASVSVSRGAGSTPVLTDSSGNYTLSGLLAGTYTLTPSKSGYTFSPTTRSVSLTGANVTGQNFTGYNATLSGRVAFSNGVGIGNVQVILDSNRTVLTNNAGYYTFIGVLPGAAHRITPSLSGYSFDPAYKTVSVTTANVSGINFIGGYAITGRLYSSSGIGLVGLRLYRSGSTSPAITNSAGYYAFYGVANGTYTVTPDATQGYGYTPQSRTVTVTDASVGALNFVGTSGYRITGRISTSNGTAIADVSVIRSGQSTPVLTNGAGYFTFNGVPNGTYTIAPSKPGYSFSPANKTVTINAADGTAQNFIGAPQ